jgi:hypothetical protein
MANTVTIGCKLPNGIVLELPDKDGKIVTVTLAGSNSSKVLGALHGETGVDADFWAGWKSANKDFVPFKSGAIFEAKTPKDAAAKAKDTPETGLEPLPQKAMGVEPAEKD